MPIVDTTQAAALTFDSAVSRALSRRLSDTPYPHDGNRVAAITGRADADAEAPPATDIPAAGAG